MRQQQQQQQPFISPAFQSLPHPESHHQQQQSLERSSTPPRKRSLPTSPPEPSSTNAPRPIQPRPTGVSSYRQPDEDVPRKRGRPSKADMQRRRTAVMIQARGISTTTAATRRPGSGSGFSSSTPSSPALPFIAPQQIQPRMSSAVPIQQQQQPSPPHDAAAIDRTTGMSVEAGRARQLPRPPQMDLPSPPPRESRLPIGAEALLNPEVGRGQDMQQQQGSDTG